MKSDLVGGDFKHHLFDPLKVNLGEQPLGRGGAKAILNPCLVTARPFAGMCLCLVPPGGFKGRRSLLNVFVLIWRPVSLFGVILGVFFHELSCKHYGLAIPSFGTAQ